MAQFKHIPAARIVAQTSVEGRTAAGELVRIALVETERVTYLQRFVDGVGTSMTQYSGARQGEAQAAYAQAQADELVAEPVVEAEAVAEAVAQPARLRGPSRPDAETQVWAEGDLEVVMVTGRAYRYDLRRGADTIESLPATRAWRTERKALITKAAGLLAA
ncbi:MAG: hypothetical protein WCI67_21950 [Chloroflexales bacterium]